MKYMHHRSRSGDAQLLTAAFEPKKKRKPTKRSPPAPQSQTAASHRLKRWSVDPAGIVLDPAGTAPVTSTPPLSLSMRTRLRVCATASF